MLPLETTVTKVPHLNEEDSPIDVNSSGRKRAAIGKRDKNHLTHALGVRRMLCGESLRLRHDACGKFTSHRFNYLEQTSKNHLWNVHAVSRDGDYAHPGADV